MKILLVVFTTLAVVLALSLCLVLLLEETMLLLKTLAPT